MKYPKTVKIGAITVSIEEIAGDSGFSSPTLGQYTSQTATIKLDKATAGDQRKAVLLHEVIHAILDIHGIDASMQFSHAQNEALVSMLEPALLLLIKTNPKLMEYLTNG